MKAIVGLLIALTLAACGGTQQSAQNPPPTVPTPSPTPAYAACTLNCAPGTYPTSDCKACLYPPHYPPVP